MSVVSFITPNDDHEDDNENTDLHLLIEHTGKVRTAQQLIQLLKARLLIIKSLNDKYKPSTLGSGSLDDNITTENVVKRLFRIIEGKRRSELAINRGIQFKAFSKLSRDTNNLKNSGNLLTTLLDTSIKLLTNQADLVFSTVDSGNKMFENIPDVRIKMLNYMHDETVSETEEEDTKNNFSLISKKIKTINRMKFIMESLTAYSGINWMNAEKKVLLNIIMKWRTFCTIETICQKYDIPKDVIQNLYKKKVCIPT